MITIFQLKCENMNFADKSRYNGMFQKVVHKGGESSINCINIFQNDKDLEISVGNSYSEDQFMHTVLDNFQHGGMCSSQKPSHQAELRREEKLVDQKLLSISA